MGYAGKVTTRLPPKGRLSKQFRRVLPFYIVCVIFFLLYNADWFGTTVVETRAAGIKFPRKIWQTWKIDPLRFRPSSRFCATSWVSKNPGYRYEVLTDDNEMYFVETAYGPDGLNRPDIVELYRSLTLTIVKADLLRYLVMYAEGGLYTDIDVEAIRPIPSFIPPNFDEEQIDMVVGVEIDEPSFKDHAILGPKSRSFCQWTFMCKPRLPVVMRLIEQVMEYLKDAARRQNVDIADIRLDFDEIISGTGPSAFTNAILAHMSSQTGREVTWDSFHSLTEARELGGILVLTVQAFAAGQGHSNSGDHESELAMVKHHYHASSWPSNHPRYTHPIFGPVEACNWVPDCVKAWDEGTRAFNALSPEEQYKQVQIKQKEDAQKAKELAAKTEMQKQQRLKIQQQILEHIQKEEENETEIEKQQRLKIQRQLERQIRKEQGIVQKEDEEEDEEEEMQRLELEQQEKEKEKEKAKPRG